MEKGKIEKTKRKKKDDVPHVVKVLESYPPIYVYSDGTSKRIHQFKCNTDES